MATKGINDRSSTEVPTAASDVRLLTLGAEIGPGTAENLIAVMTGDVLRKGERIVWFSEQTSSFRFGLVASVASSTSVVAGPDGVSVQFSPKGDVRVFAVINLMRFREQQSVPEKWIIGRVLGQGAFGCVVEAIDLRTGSRLAIKQIPIKDVREVDQLLGKLCTEINMLRLLSHINIVQFLGTHIDHSIPSLFIFMELVAGGSIAQCIREYGALPEKLVRNYTRQILAGLQHLHEKNIIHRDIKGSNILLTNEGVVKLADFGAARFLQDACGLSSGDQELKSLCGTPNWMAPEVVKQHGYGQRPWDHSMNQFQVLMAIAQTDRTPAIPSALSEAGRDFCSKCLTRDKTLRPSVAQLLTHEWIAEPDATIK